ncbi:unnamed protein product [Rotaria socialis]|uniref:ETS domain-containing protein n=1 Tax=Rotaria socialis TaxID=392032 RepID=A0A821C8E6_9BILA|nr:unnamed protein product [Rotaria socialis]CAF3315308.1 unnamed protein product [Rotaria socialis]CAF3396676.1 unnamed protein product [Rotaria socialis]CAF3426671.1 unnamed protein product [Rotaria socialis]CAF3465243.1 unnamed protein product [Rotaria socialis]
MMFNEADENYDPVLIESIIDFDPNTMCIEQEPSDIINTLSGWLSDSISSHIDIDSIDSFSDHSEIFSFEIPLNRKEWLVEDLASKRQRSPRLFEFLILLLGKPQYKPFASFIDKPKGIFQIYQPEKVAELWQAVKSRQSNQRMTYDKFARAIRWYYKSNIMQKTNTRYTFQFSSKTLKNYFVDENNNTKLSLHS